MRRVGSILSILVLTGCARTISAPSLLPDTMAHQRGLTSGTFQTIYIFRGEPDGAVPQGQLLSVKGVLYGTTNYGGDSHPFCYPGNGCGTVYSINPKSAVYMLLYSFGGLLYGDGAFPNAELIKAKKELWGTTTAGGDGQCNISGGCGTVFSITTAGSEMVQWSFQGGKADGAAPFGPLMQFDHNLYGTTMFGGSTAGCGGKGCGAVYEITPPP